MKKFIPALAAFGSSVVAFAEDSSIQTSVNTEILTASKTALDSLMTTALPIVGALLVAGLTIWGAFKLVGLIAKAFGWGTRR